ncbi:MAG: hypothetical protein H7338_04810 [Candidatus Sericytochromatia bacterium]|nr:hypothetical protein [Candidatus Sericytochromatia bacterium]
MAEEQPPSGGNNPGGNQPPKQDSVSLSRPNGPKNRNAGLKEKRSPERVITADMMPTDPFQPEDIDDETMIAPGKRMIGNAYANTAQPKLLAQASPTQVAESAGGTDVLALASANQRSGQTVSFKVKGISWRAGFSKDFAQTPLGHAIHPHPLPLRETDPPEALVRMGVVIRTVNPRLQVVLGQLLPGAFRKELTRARGKADKLRHLAIFYLPNPQAAAVGFVHEYVQAKNPNNIFYLYVQTTVGKAPVGILDEVLRTLEAGLPEGEKSDDLEYDEDDDDDLPEKEFDFSSEIEQSMAQVRSTFKSSMMVHSYRRSTQWMQTLMMTLIRFSDWIIARVIRGVTVVIILVGNSWPIRFIAAIIAGIGTGIIRTVWAINRTMLAIGRSPVTRGLVNGVAAVFSGISWVFLGIGRGFSLFGRGIVAIFRAPGRMVEMGRDGIDSLRNRGESKAERAKVVAKAKAVGRPKAVAAKGTASKQLPAPPKAKAPSAPGSKKSPLGFFEDRPIKKP